jgi:hypothetical protein
MSIAARSTPPLMKFRACGVVGRAHDAIALNLFNERDSRFDAA